jgi:tetratricopeptide (TPR) repeat protein
MSVRKLLLGSVCTAWLAASAAVGGVQAAENASVQLATAAYKTLASGDRAKAIAEYSEAIESKELPSDVLANALLNRGLAYQQSAQYQDAIDDYSAALRIDALSAKLRATALYNRGLAYQKSDRASLAIEDFTSALFLDSEFSYCYYSRAIALRDSGQYLFALSDFEKARRYNHPQPHLVYYGEALVYEALKRSDEASKSLRKALALKPDFAPARQHLSALGEVPPADTAKPADIDNLTTGSISAASGAQIAAKQALPEAVKPPESLLSSASEPPTMAAPSKKKYTDRILPEDTPQVTLASAAETVRQPAERVVAVEAVPMPDAQKPAVAPQPAPAPSTEADAVEPPAASPVEPAGWSVQLSSAKNEKLAWGTWEKMKAKHKLLAGQQPIVIRADLGAKGIFYRLRLAGFADSNAASAVCSKLKSKGLSCFISRVNS